MAGSESPFCALTVTVDFNDRGIDHGVFHVGFVGYRREQAREHVGSDPVAETAIYRVPFAKDRRQVAPGAAGSCDP